MGSGGECIPSLDSRERSSQPSYVMRFLLKPTQELHGCNGLSQGCYIWTPEVQVFWTQGASQRIYLQKMVNTVAPTEESFMGVIVYLKCAPF